MNSTAQFVKSKSEVVLEGIQQHSSEPHTDCDGDHTEMYSAMSSALTVEKITYDKLQGLTEQ